MDIAAYAVEAEAEATHWWFRGRRRLFAREIKKTGLPRTSRVLDVGTSTGANLRLLRDLGFRALDGLDFSQEAIHYCQEKGLGFVQLGDVCGMPFANGSFDLVLATDIIEHVDDDLKALREIGRVLTFRARRACVVITDTEPDRLAPLSGGALLRQPSGALLRRRS